MRITFVTRKFGNVERNYHCDVLHITPIRVARLFLDCNGVFAIKAYAVHSLPICMQVALSETTAKPALKKHLDSLCNIAYMYYKVNHLSGITS